MVAADLAARAARPPPQPPARDRRRRRRRRRPARVDRHVPVRDHVEDDRARDRARPGRLAGRGAAAAPARRDVLARSAASRASQRRCRCSFAPTTGLRGQHAAARRRPPAPARCSGCPPATRRRSRARSATLSGRATGVLLAQQTAANLHARPGDTSPIGRPGGRRPGPRRRRHRPAGGRLAVPAGRRAGRRPAAGAARQRRPAARGATFEPVSSRAGAPELIRTQVHAVSHRPARQPERRLHAVSGTRPQPRDAAGRRRPRRRQPRHGARPGAPGRALRPAAVPLPRRPGRDPRRPGHRVDRRRRAPDRRRRDAALLRTRGASTRRLVRIALAETRAGRRRRRGGRPWRARWSIGARRVRHRQLRRRRRSPRRCGRPAPRSPGSPIAAAAIALPAWRDARALTVAGQRAQVGRRDRPPWWARYGLDFAALAGSRRSSTGRRRATATSSCSPPRACRRSRSTGTRCSRRCSPGSARACSPTASPTLVLARGRTPLARLLRPLAGELAPTRSPRRWAASAGCWPRAVALVALTAAFAASTAVFNSTYQQQAEVDARLTNGADVTVTESPGARVGPRGAGALARVPGVRSVEPLQHRFAYVGADLQDLYGVRPATIGAAGKLQDAWFAGGTRRRADGDAGRAAGRGARLAPRPSRTSSCSPGDLCGCGCRTGAPSSFTTVPFHYVGVAKEFPTAPTRLVPRRQRRAMSPGDRQRRRRLLPRPDRRHRPRAPSRRRVRARARHRREVTDIDDQRRVVGSNLTAVELSGLTKVELGFALLLAAAASGLALGLGFRERRRTLRDRRRAGRARRASSAALSGASRVFVTGGGLALGDGRRGRDLRMLVEGPHRRVRPAARRARGPLGLPRRRGRADLAAVGAAGAVTLRALRRPAIEELRGIRRSPRRTPALRPRSGQRGHDRRMALTVGCS